MFQNLQGKSAAQVFWLKLMNSRIQKKFLTMKDLQQSKCLSHNNFEEYYECVKKSKDQMDTYMLQMQFYQKKFEICIDEGINKAKYKQLNVYNICSRKMTQHMKKNKL